MVSLSHPSLRRVIVDKETIDTFLHADESRITFQQCVSEVDPQDDPQVILPAVPDSVRAVLKEFSEESRRERVVFMVMFRKALRDQPCSTLSDVVSLYQQSVELYVQLIDSYRNGKYHPTVTDTLDVGFCFSMRIQLQFFFIVMLPESELNKLSDVFFMKSSGCLSLYHRIVKFDRNEFTRKKSEFTELSNDS